MIVCTLELNEHCVNKYVPLFSSLREPDLPDTILPDVPVTYTEVEQGTQRKGAKLVSSDGYEYTKKVSTGFFFWQDNTLYAYNNVMKSSHFLLTLSIKKN